jgi:prepilin-type N-terminal cleavage/methylation domain-containing protein
MKRQWKRGMTLVEVLVALAILALAMTMLVSGVVYAGSLLRRSTDIKNEGQLAAGNLDQIETTAPGEPGSVTIYGISIPGTYQTVIQGDVSFLIFVPAAKDDSK